MLTTVEQIELVDLLDRVITDLTCLLSSITSKHKDFIGRLETDETQEIVTRPPLTIKSVESLAYDIMSNKDVDIINRIKEIDNCLSEQK